MCPKNEISDDPILHFFVWHVSPNLLRRSRTLSKWAWCSYFSLENITIQVNLYEIVQVPPHYFVHEPYENHWTIFEAEREDSKMEKTPSCSESRVVSRIFIKWYLPVTRLKVKYAKYFRTPHLPNHFI